MRPAAFLCLFGCLVLLAAPLAAQQAPPEGEEPLPEEITEDVIGPSLLPGPPDFGPVAAEPDPNAVITALARLYNRGPDRRFFGLPADVTWRAPGAIRVALYSDQREAQAPLIRATTAAFAAASGLPLDLATARPLSAIASAEAVRNATGANLEILVGSRAVMAQFAGALGVNQTMLFRFEDGRWPFSFIFPRQPDWIGRVLIASDEPAEAIEASLILAVVWALGGVSLGSEMQGLIDPLSIEPALTPLGQSVFALMYHPELEAGMTVPEALLRARVLLGL